MNIQTEESLQNSRILFLGKLKPSHYIDVELETAIRTHSSNFKIDMLTSLPMTLNRSSYEEIWLDYATTNATVTECRKIFDAKIVVALNSSCWDAGRKVLLEGANDCAPRSELFRQFTKLLLPKESTIRAAQRLTAQATK